MLKTFEEFKQKIESQEFLKKFSTEPKNPTYNYFLKLN